MKIIATFLFVVLLISILVATKKLYNLTKKKNGRRK